MTAEIVFDHPLRNGSVTVSQETKEGVIYLHFAAVIETQHPAKVIFEQIIQGFTDSHKSWLWPVKYETAPEPLPYEVHEGCRFRMGYRVPRMDNPDELMPEVVYTYRLKTYRPDEFLFEYESIDHPLEGGGTVRAVPTSETTSRFDWRGTYCPKAGQERVIDSLRHYLPPLYEEFERNIEAGPR